MNLEGASVASPKLIVRLRLAGFILSPNSPHWTLQSGQGKLGWILTKRSRTLASGEAMLTEYNGGGDDPNAIIGAPSPKH